MDWSTEEITERYFEILPELLTAVNTRKNPNKALKIVFTSIVPIARVDCLEEVIFSEFCRITTDYYFELISSVEKLVLSNRDDSDDGKSDDNDILNRTRNALEACMEIIICLEESVSYLLRVSDTLKIPNVKSFVSNTLHLLGCSYKHCRDSNSIYGNFFNGVSVHLSSIFKKSFELQTSILKLLEVLEQHLRKGEDDQESLLTLAEVVNTLTTICDAVMSLDDNATIGSWKFIFRICTTHGSEITECIDAETIIKVLCRQVHSMFSEIDDPNKQVDVRLLKFLDFKLRILVTMVSQYKSVMADSIDDIIHLVCSIKEISHLKVDDAERGKLFHENVAIVTEPLILHLASNSRFLESVTGVGNDVRMAFGKLLILLTLLQSNDVIDGADWTAESLNPPIRCFLLKSIFDHMKLCQVHMDEPLKIGHCSKSDRSSGQSNLYEDVLKVLLFYVVQTPESNFTEIEEVLLENLLHGPLYNSMLSCDVWCFIARVCSAELCCQHFSTLSDLLEKTLQATENVLDYHERNRCDNEIRDIKAGKISRKLLMLQTIVRRMFNFLPFTEQVRMYEKHHRLHLFVSPSKNSTSDDMISSKILNTLNSINSIIENMSDRRLKQDILSLLHKVTFLDILFAHNPPLLNCKETSLKLLISLSSVIQTTLFSVRSHTCICNKIIFVAVRAFSKIIPVALDKALASPILIGSYETLIKTFKYLDKFIRTEEPGKRKDFVCISILPLIETLASLIFITCKEEIIQSIARLMSGCILLKQSFARELSLETFSVFASETIHADVLVLCNRSDKRVNQITVQYIEEIESGRTKCNVFNSKDFESHFEYWNKIINDDQEKEMKRSNNQMAKSRDEEQMNCSHDTCELLNIPVDKTKDNPKQDHNKLVSELLSLIEEHLVSLSGIVQSGYALDVQQNDRLFAINETVAKCM